MKVYLNYDPVEMPEGASIGDLLSHQGIPSEGSAVAIDNKVIPKSEWAAYVLRDEQHVTLIRATCGG